MTSEVRNLIERLRDSSEKLKAQSGDMRFPGWDLESGNEKSRAQAHRVRNAAWAILNNTDFDSSVKVAKADVAALIHFVADMLEE